MSNLYNLGPVLHMALLAVSLGLVPLAWFWLRHRQDDASRRLRALTLITLFLTFDLVIFGAFTRLSDSGLGCPDWPGCYGQATPFGAHAEIQAAQSALPSGPVTHGKAWVEMVHRYGATVVGFLITVLMAMNWWQARKNQSAISPWWSTVTWFWVCAQGAFGALTVTMKLYPAIVTLHLLGGLGLLALLAVQAQRQTDARWVMPRWLHFSAAGVGVLCVVQIALGGWVSTNYAVLACTEFPGCQGTLWPAMDLRHGFEIWRPLGQTGLGTYLPFEALTAIHMVHRWGAVMVSLAVLALSWRLWRRPWLRRWALYLAALLLWQWVSGLSNVVLGWPLLAALAHTAGASGFVVVLTTLLAGSSWPLDEPAKAYRI